MEFKILPIIALLSVAIVVSHAALPSEEYWNSVLPNTPMPKAVKDLLQPAPDWLDDKTNVNVGGGKGGGGVNVNTPSGTHVGVGGGQNGGGVNVNTPGGTHVGVGGGQNGGGVNVNTPGGTHVGVGGGKGGGGGVNVNTPGGTHVGVGGGNGGGGVNVNTPGGTVGVGGGNGGGGVNVNTPGGTHVGVGGGKNGVNVGVNVPSHNGNHKGKGKNGVNVHVGNSPFKYNYAAAATQLHDDPSAALFFLEKDLFAGNKMTLRFSNSSNQETFLPRQLADSIPFSSDKLPEIFTKFSVKPATDEAAAIKKTIQECESGASVKGEEKFCATSLESMVDFSTAVLGGKDVSAVSTEADGGERKVYRVAAVKRLTSEKKKAAAVVCHQQEYAYAVFYCHKTDTTVAYGVSLVGAGGSKAEAVAVCHRDTAEWNPKHLAFQVLKVKPGTVPICHYLPENHIVWVSKN